MEMTWGFGLVLGFVLGAAFLVIARFRRTPVEPQTV